MGKKLICFFIKTIVAVAVFVLLFCAIQPFFIPKYIRHDAETTVLVNSFRQLEENSVDVLFLGSSQMFRSIDSGRLYDTYGINAYNYGASGQAMSITPYYFKEALKTQTPKLIAVEVGCIFVGNDDITQKEIAWNYAPTPPTKEKYESLKEVLGNVPDAIEHTFLPLLVYHDRWRTLAVARDSENAYDIDYVLHPERYNGMYPRGFVGLDIVNKQDVDFDNSDPSLKEIPDESKNAIDFIAEVCADRGIRLFFFKTPAPDWTSGASASVKSFMNERGLEYIDMNDSCDEMALDGAADFSDETHLNSSGARKVTDYMAGILPRYMD